MSTAVSGQFRQARGLPYPSWFDGKIQGGDGKPSPLRRKDLRTSGSKLVAHRVLWPQPNHAVTFSTAHDRSHRDRAPCGPRSFARFAGYDGGQAGSKKFLTL